MNKLVHVFRAFLAAAAVCHVAWFFFYDWYGPLSDLEIRVAQIDGYGSNVFFSEPMFYWAWFASWSICLIGLYLLKNWARNGYLLLTMLMQSLIPFSGYVAEIPLDYLLTSTFLILSGAILAMSYFSPVAEYFQGKLNQ